MFMRRMFAHRHSEEVLCNRTMATCHRSRIFFTLSVALSTLYLVGTGYALLSDTPPALSHILLGAVVTFALVMLCLEIAAGSHGQDTENSGQISRI